MENYDIYNSTTNREYKEQAEKAMKTYYDTFEGIETVRVSPRLQYVKKRLKQKKHQTVAVVTVMVSVELSDNVHFPPVILPEERR